MKTLIIFCLLSVCFVAMGVFYVPSALIPAAFCAGAALLQTYRLGAQQGFVVDEDNLHPEIYQVIAVTMDGKFPVAILRSNKKKRIACRSLTSDGFAYFSVVGEGNERFFVPKSLKQSTTASYPVVGDELANSHGG